MSTVPIRSPVAKSLLALPDSFGKNRFRAKVAAGARLRLAPVTVSCLVFGSIERLPVDQSMLPSAATRLAPLGSVVNEARVLRSNWLAKLVLISCVPTGGSAVPQGLGLRMLVFFLIVWPPAVSSSPALKSGATAPPLTGNV